MPSTLLQQSKMKEIGSVQYKSLTLEDKFEVPSGYLLNNITFVRESGNLAKYLISI